MKPVSLPLFGGELNTEATPYSNGSHQQWHDQRRQDTGKTNSGENVYLADDH